MQPLDTLSRWEKTALITAMAAQSLVVTRWYLGTAAPVEITELIRWLTVIISFAAGIALDLVVVTTTIGRRDGRRSFWSWMTAAGAMSASAAIALDMYGGWSPGPYLHVAYPVVIFLFMQHLAAPRMNAPQASQEVTAETEITKTIGSKEPVFISSQNVASDIQEHKAKSMNNNTRGNISQRDISAAYGVPLSTLRGQIARGETSWEKLIQDVPSNGIKVME